MGVVTWEYYSSAWLGDAPEAAFPRLDLLAEDMVCMLTRGADFERLTVAQQELYRRAVCAQIDALNLNGEQAAYAGESGGGWTVGRVRVDGGSETGMTRAARAVSPLAEGYLSAAGLLFRGVCAWGWPPC